MSTNEKSKGTKKKRRDVKKDKEPEVVKCNFAENEYTGIIRTAPLGARYLDDPAAKYTWKSGINYEGPFQSSTITGKGKFLWPDNSSYEGELLDGKRHGEGIYIASDGVTRYEGQWKQGKRDGHGKLTYQPNGEAYYDGEWQDGRKHGEGKQVWPSGNAYEGQWEMGKMSGQGKMLWRDNGRNEEYRGLWQDNHPQGVGTHIWHAPAPKANADDSGNAGPSQQMNNRYEGQWDQGVRHGNGVFYYANGSQYKGQWEQNAKHGVGKYTFEDGRVYDGPFSHDQMVNYVQPTTLNRSALNIGGEDNPVRQCIDITDLEDFALPPDVGALDLNVGTGYDETEEIIREVHNMLLRYLGELKQIYFSYRMRLKSSNEDPFVLSMHQLWLFARDCDLVTPACPLSRLDRFILSGPRQHQETAAEDKHDLRPLTPRREEDNKNAKGPQAKKGAKGPGKEAEAKGKDLKKFGAVKHGDEDQPRADSRGSEKSDGSESGSSAGSSKGSNNADDDAGDRKRDSKSPNTGATAADLKAGPKSGVIGDAEEQDDDGEEEEDEGKEVVNADGGFWRKEAASTLQNIHSPAKVLLFRHFLEGIVRIAISRYPHEKGLEHQLRKLFKDKVLPNMSKLCLSEETFSYLVNPDIQGVIKSHEDCLWRIFKNHQPGEGGYGAPLEGPGEEAAQAMGIVPMVRSRRRGFGGQQRKAHINARYDVTARVKDILRLLDVCGFLKPCKESELPSNPTEALFKSDVGLDGLDTSAVGELADSLQNLQEALQIGDGLPRPGAGSSLSNPITESGSSQIGSGGIPGFGGGGLGMVGGLGALAGGGGGLDSLLTPSESQATLPSVTPDKLLVDKKGGEKDAIPEEEAPPKDDIKAEMMQIDFTMTALEAIKWLTEICSPPSLSKLRLDVPQDFDNSNEERVSLLDYVETECVFIEFVRLLFRVSEAKTFCQPPAEKFTAPERFKCFLDDIFLPSMKKPYSVPVPPVEEPPEAAEGEGESAAGEGETKESPKEEETKEEGSAEGGEGEAAKVEEAEPPVLEYWRGFDEEIYVDDLPAPRYWPEGYDLEVQDW